MKLLELYRLLHATALSQEHEPIVKKLENSKHLPHFRENLRVIGACALEKRLYENETKTLDETELPLQDIDWNKKLATVAPKWLLPDEKLTCVFKTIYLIFNLKDIIEFQSQYVRCPNKRAFHIMACFDLMNAESALQHYDAFVTQNTLSHSGSEELFKTIHPGHMLTNTQDYLAWQRIVCDTYSLNILKKIPIASEIESKLGRAPRSEHEIDSAALLLLSKPDLSSDTLKTLLSTYTTSDERQRFLDLVPPESLQKLILEPNDFYRHLLRFRDNNQKMFLEKLGKTFILQLLHGEPSKASIHIYTTLGELKSSVVDDFIKDIIGKEAFTERFQCITEINGLIRQLPREYDVMNFLALYTEKWSKILTSDNISSLLTSIPKEHRKAFLLNTVRQSTCSNLISSVHTLTNILTTLPDDNSRIDFIEKGISPQCFLDLKQQHDISSTKHSFDTKHTWHAYILPKMELQAKQTLKNIKKRLLQTSDPENNEIETKIGKHKLHTTKQLWPHVVTFFDLNKKEISYPKALQQIQSHGKKEAEKSNTLLNSMYHTLFKKTPTQAYLETFLNEETFQEAYGPKK